jgi:HdeA/HdeB family
MNAKISAVVLSGLLVACAQAQPPNAAAPPAPPPPSTAPQAAAPAQALAPAPGAASAPAPAATQGTAPADHVVDIQRATCQGLMSLPPADRGDAAMFYIGYQASRLRARTIDVSLIPSIEAQAFVYCSENPDRPVAQAFAQAYPRARQ